MKNLVLLVSIFFSASLFGEAFAADATTKRPQALPEAVKLGKKDEKKDEKKEEKKDEANRAPAMVAQGAAYSPGDYAIVQNSVEDWNDRVAMITDIFEDGSIRIKLEDGTKALIRKKNIDTSLSPLVPCIEQGRSKICTGDKVYYPSADVSLAIPEGTVEYMFANGRVILLDGNKRVVSADEIGKEVKCSPQKESICKGDYVLANGVRQNRPFSFEGPVERVYSNGVAIVRAGNWWRYPIGVEGLMERVATTEADTMGSVISSRAVQEKIPSRVTPELRTEEDYLDPSLLPAY